MVIEALVQGRRTPSRCEESRIRCCLATKWLPPAIITSINHSSPLPSSSASNDHHLIPLQAFFLTLLSSQCQDAIHQTYFRDTKLDACSPCLFALKSNPPPRPLPVFHHTNRSGPYHATYWTLNPPEICICTHQGSK